MSELKKLDEKFGEMKQEKIEELFNQLYPAQKEFFGRIFPNGIKNLGDKFNSAFSLIERTLLKNEQKEKP